MSYSDIWGYILRDGAEILCEDCAYSALLDMAHDGTTIENRTARAAIRLAAARWAHPTPEDVERIIRDMSYDTSPRSRRILASSALSDECSPCFDGSESAGGEWCGQCSRELAPTWCECEVCGRDGSIHDITPAVVTDDGNGEGYRVVCESCWQDWRDLLAPLGFTLSDDEADEILATLDAQTWPVPRWTPRRPDGTLALGTIIARVKRARVERSHVAEMFPEMAAA
jgi:hypothetical protein